MKALHLKERRRIQLEMLSEFDKFCRENQLKYMIAFGTLIGAIRHKGFIPWDDDMDICMPIDDLNRMKKILHSDTIRYIDVDTEPTYLFAFSRIVHKASFSRSGYADTFPGVCIDLYPCFECLKEEDQMSAFFEKAFTLDKIAKSWSKWCMRILRRIPLRSIPGVKRRITRLRDAVYNDCIQKGSGNYYIFAGELDFRNVYDFNPFEKLIDVEFEGHTYMAPANYDKYLSHFYGDYMTPPPVDQQVPYHTGARYYLKFS